MRSAFLLLMFALFALPTVSCYAADEDTSTACSANQDCIAIEGVCSEWEAVNTHFTSIATERNNHARSMAKCVTFDERIKKPNIACVEGKCVIAPDAEHCMQRGERTNKCIFDCGKWDDKGRCTQEEWHR